MPSGQCIAKFIFKDCKPTLDFFFPLGTEKINMKLIVFSLFVCNLITTSYEESVENQLRRFKQEMEQKMKKI